MKAGTLEELVGEPAATLFRKSFPIKPETKFIRLVIGEDASLDALRFGHYRYLILEERSVFDTAAYFVPEFIDVGIFQEYRTCQNCHSWYLAYVTDRDMLFIA